MISIFNSIDNFNTWVQESKLRVYLVVFFFGCLCKMVVIFGAYIHSSAIALFTEFEGFNVPNLKKAYPEGVGTFTPLKFISALIVAPLVENMILPITHILSKKLNLPHWIGVLGICALSFYLHFIGGGISGGITGLLLFSFMYIQYVTTLKKYGPKQSYKFSVVMHFAFNFATFGFLAFLNMLIFYS